MGRIAQCSCGKLKVEVEGEPVAVVACHCSECQRRTGSVFGVGAYYMKDKVKTSGPNKTYVRDGAAGRKMRNHFCPDCGTNLFWEAELIPNSLGVAVGGFRDPEFARPTRSVWEENKHHWVEMNASVPGFLQGRDGKAAPR
jgi:hypothetical protein